MDEVMFRFANVRPPQRKTLFEESVDALDPYRGGRYRTDLQQRISEALERGDSAAARSAAAAFYSSNQFVQRLEQLQTALARFDKELVKQGPKLTSLNLPQIIRQIFDGEPAAVIQREQFKQDRRALADSVYASFFAGQPAARRARLVRGLRLSELIERVAAKDELVSQNEGIARALQATVMLPLQEDALAATALTPAARDAELERVTPSVPTTAGSVQPAGVSDLLIVRQRLRRYERGEIAHIENVLMGEFSERSHRRTQTTDTLVFQETETTNEIERDLQSTERFELKNEASRTIQEDTQAQAGVTVTGSYGTVQVTATGAFSYERSIEEATRSASIFARDVAKRAVDRVQERVLERRSTRTVLEIEEIAKHGLDNTKRDQHIVGIYRWVDKVYEAQIVNYGRRLMLEFLAPEPAAYYRVLQQNRAAKGVTRQPPQEPMLTLDDGSRVRLRPELIKWPDIQALAALYDTTDIAPPPAESVVVGGAIEVPHTDQDHDTEASLENPGVWLQTEGATKVSSEIKIPSGYVATHAAWSGDQLAYVRKSPLERDAEGGGSRRHWSAYLNFTTRVSVGSGTFDRDGETEVQGFTDTLPVAVITSAAGLVVTFRVVCQRTPELLSRWQVQTYKAIMTAYQARMAEYEELIARAQVESGPQIQGRNPAQNRDIERTELKRASISILTAQHFDLFGAISDPAQDDVSKYPLIDFEEVAAEGQYVQFFEQVLEWNNMTYVFYPYFWGRRQNWPDLLDIDDTDPLFTKFLKAGYARVQVPVRPKYETMVLYFLSSGQIWREADDAPVPQPYLPLIEELRTQTSEDFLPGPGKVSLRKDLATATGEGTQFSDDDIDREIRIAGRVYRIEAVQSPTSITLSKTYPGPAPLTVTYSLGPKLVGDPWEVRLPTSLVMIDVPSVTLPSWPDE